MEMARFRLNDCNVKEGVQRIDYVRATYVWMQTEGTRTDPKDTRMLLVIAWRREATCMQVLILGMGRAESNMDLFFPHVSWWTQVACMVCGQAMEN